MELIEDDKQIQEDACAYINAHKDELIQKFITQKKPLKLGFMSLFMAGSPGAGKTEFSLQYIPLIYTKDSKSTIKLLESNGIKPSTFESLFIRIDVDEIRAFLPQYRKTDTFGKGNAHVVQKAANKGLDALRNYCLKNEISFLHDGTFGNYKTMHDLVQESLAKDRFVEIYYLYLDPIAAWNFTKAREYTEGRNILKEKFIEQFFASQVNVQKIKNAFAEKVSVVCVLKDKDNKVRDIVFNTQSIDRYMQTQYSKGIVRRYTHEELEVLLK
jgi:hypothetical protein